jgi:hypothetical protein
MNTVAMRIASQYRALPGPLSMFRRSSGAHGHGAGVHRVMTTLVACGMLALLASCGSSTKQSAGSLPAPGGASAAAGSSTSQGEAGPGALAADANSAATGDIPDTQAFLVYHNAARGFSMSYPEGWAIKEHGPDVTISEKNNLLHVVIERAAPPNIASVTAELQRLKASDPSLTFSAPTVVKVTSGSALKTTYTTRSAPNPVTGKSVLLVVDRYELGRDGKRAIVDLGTPKGVDNVDAYRMIINSFRWQ